MKLDQRRPRAIPAQTPDGLAAGRQINPFPQGPVVIQQDDLHAALRYGLPSSPLIIILFSNPNE